MSLLCEVSYTHRIPPHAGPSPMFQPTGTAYPAWHVNPHWMVPFTSLGFILVLFWILREPLHWTKKMSMYAVFLGNGF